MKDGEPGPAARPEEMGTLPSSAEDQLVPIDFSTFVLSLASSAMVNLGMVPGPEDQADAARDPDLPAAKQIIDILSILEQKTQGNLEESEDKLLRSVLYDLRVQFCDAQKKKGGGC